MWSASCPRKTLRASPTLARREAAKAASGRTARSDPDPRGLSLDRLRDLRDRLREHVWRLVARQGWYKLQPVRMLRFSAEQRQHA